MRRAADDVVQSDAQILSYIHLQDNLAAIRQETCVCVCVFGAPSPSPSGSAGITR